MKYLTELTSNVMPLSVMQTGKGLEPAVAALDFTRLRHKYTASNEAEMTAQEWALGEQEYRRFLSLKLCYPGIALVPSKLVDKIWHAHILDTKAYREDCDKVFGKFIDHFPYFGIYGKEDYRNLQSAFKETQALYEEHFGAYPGSSPLGEVASRCQDHACHVPSECACRSSGACK